MCLGQRCLREHVELAVLHPPHHHWLLLHAQPGVRCAVRVSTYCEDDLIRAFQEFFTFYQDLPHSLLDLASHVTAAFAQDKIKWKDFAFVFSHIYLVFCNRESVEHYTKLFVWVCCDRQWSSECDMQVYAILCMLTSRCPWDVILFYSHY